ncbi:MAG: hypothetical protein ACW981_19740 [Candidatus Hodarchaeales archaeon]|jgi:hypothetical protein
MSYFGAALGSAIGMMIGLVIFSNAWRLKSFLPKTYDFTHEWGKKFVNTDKKAYTYTVRLIIGVIFHPIVFVFIWSSEGLLKINLFDNDIISAVVLLLIEAVLFGIVIWFDFIKIRPENLKSKVITLQIGVHIVIGTLMGFFYTLF